MRQILEETVLFYTQEAWHLAVLVSPAALLAPILVVVASAGLVAALATLLVLLLLYLVVYAACVRAAALVQSNLAPDAVRAYSDAFARGPEVLRVALPGGVVLAATCAAGLVLSHRGDAWLIPVAGAAGAAGFSVWAVRHALDLPAVMALGLSAAEAGELRARLGLGGYVWSGLLLAATGLPLALVGLLAWSFAVMAPALGLALFAMALPFWFPLPAFSLTALCAHFTGAYEPAHS